MTSKIIATYSDKHGSPRSSCERCVFFLCDSVSVKAQFCHLGAQPGTGDGVFTCGVIIRELFILNIAVIANTGISSHTKLTRYR